MKKDLKEFKTFPSSTIKEIQRAANEGIYQIRGLGAKRKVPDFDDLVFLGARSEEHTSELQSRSDLVCRLLLEKKTPNSCYYARKEKRKLNVMDKQCEVLSSCTVGCVN